MSRAKQVVCVDWVFLGCAAGHFLGISVVLESMTPYHSPAAGDLRPLLKRGLPADGEVIADDLLSLPGVAARASTGDRDSRVTAFNALLRQMFQHLADPGQSIAVAKLFGEDRATAGSTLTERRIAAAASIGRDPDHFRKHIEPRILAEVAAALAADSARMAATRAVPPPLIPVLKAPPGLPEDMWAWEAVEHEEYISRLWASVYALRAELLACARLASFDPLSADLRDAADVALWRLGQLQVVIRSYRRAYGNRLLHGEIALETLIGMAGWSPPLEPAEIDLVCDSSQEDEPYSAFVTRLTASKQSRDLRGRWFRHLSAPRTVITDAWTGSAA